jgi:ppGpp synthetase/RelA/SpoT-type nucleotidyltranferase
MNFIIAVINESFTNCRNTQVELTMQVRLGMVVKRESMMTQEELKNSD